MNTTHSSSHTKAFTLIELLVVIAIIGILSSVVLASVNTARAKSRDARRMSDLREVQKALEFYYDDYNAYPSTGGSWWGSSSECHGGPHGDGTIPGLIPDYMARVPQDPMSSGGNCYLYRSDGVDYMFLAHGTIETFDPDIGPHPLDRPCCNQQTIAVYSPGGRNW